MGVYRRHAGPVRRFSSGSAGTIGVTGRNNPKNHLHMAVTINNLLAPVLPGARFC